MSAVTDDTLNISITGKGGEVISEVTFNIATIVIIAIIIIIVAVILKKG